MSNIYCLKMLGANVSVCGPMTLMPKYLDDIAVLLRQSRRAAVGGADISVTISSITVAVYGSFEVRFSISP